MRVVSAKLEKHRKFARHETTSDCEISVLKLPDDVAKWDLIQSFFELRQAVFVEQMGWTLPNARRKEFEQYDLPGVTEYVIAHIGDEALAGVRLVRCDTALGTPEQVSYMIRDAWLGRIDLPRQLCSERPPTDAQTWELTRLVSKSKDPSITTMLLRATSEYLKGRGATHCLCLGSPIIMRFAKSLGFRPRPLGPILGNKDGRFLAFICDVI